MAFEHVKPGDDFQVKAFEWNAILDAGAARRRHQVGTKAEGLELLALAQGNGLVRVINNTGADRNRYACVSLGAARWVLDRNQRVEGIVFNTAAADPWKPIAILQQPLKAGDIGAAIIFGPSLVDVASGGTSSFRWAIADASSHTLKATTGGQVRLLDAPPSGGGVVLAMVGQIQNYWRYKLTGNMPDGDLSEGDATLFNLDNSTTGLSVKVVNQHAVYDSQLTDNGGSCHEVNGKFYAEIAPC